MIAKFRKREKVGTPIRLMTKLIGLRGIRANVTVPFKLEFAKILSREVHEARGRPNTNS